MKAMPIQDGRINLYSFVDGNPPQRTVKYATGFSPEWEGDVIYVIDWKIIEDKVRLTYQTRNDLYAPVYDNDFALVSQTLPVAKPGKSKNWTWNDFGSYWFNKCTGQRVPVY